jgi:hypothetical protein
VDSDVVYKNEIGLRRMYGEENRRVISDDVTEFCNKDGLKEAMT